MVEAITYPVSGPEACAAFKAGLKPHLYKRLMDHPEGRREFTDLAKVVALAKEIEDTAVLTGQSESGGPEPTSKKRKAAQPGSKPSHKSRLGPQGSGGSRGTVVSEPWAQFGLSEAEYKARRANHVCFWCKSSKHRAPDCPTRRAGPSSPRKSDKTSS